MSFAQMCPTCGAATIQAVGEGSYRCTSCGASLGLCPLPGDGVQRCVECREIVLRDAHFCHQCGTELRFSETLVVLRDCPACKRLVPVASSFCPYCRAEIVAREETLPLTYSSIGRYRESVGCPACGRTVGHTAQVCRYCGVNIEEFIAGLRQQGMDNLPSFDRRFEEERRQRNRQNEQPIRLEKNALSVLVVVLFGGIVLLWINVPASTFIVDSLFGLEGSREIYCAGLFFVLSAIEIGLALRATRWWVSRK